MLNDGIKGGPSTQGWLLKKGGRITVKWQRRHFRLKDYQLKYYKEDKEGIDEQGGFSVQDAKIDVVPKAKYKKEYVLELYSPTDSRTYVVQAENKDNMLDWITIIRKAATGYQEAKRKMELGEFSSSSDSEDDVIPAPSQPRFSMPAPPPPRQSNASISQVLPPPRTQPPIPEGGESDIDSDEQESDDDGPPSRTASMSGFRPPPPARGSLRPSKVAGGMMIMPGLPGLPGNRATLSGALSDLSKYGETEGKEEDDDDILGDIPDIAEREMWFKYMRVKVDSLPEETETKTRQDRTESEVSVASTGPANLPPPPGGDAWQNADPMNAMSSDEDEMAPPPPPADDDMSDFSESGDDAPPAPPPQDEDGVEVVSLPEEKVHQIGGDKPPAANEESDGEEEEDVPEYVFFNPVTNQVVLDDPAEMTEAERSKLTNQFGALQQALGDEQRDIIPTQKARRNSAILSESLTQGARDKTVDKRTRIAIMLRDIIDNCENVIASNIGGPILPNDMDEFRKIMETVSRIKEDMYSNVASVEEKDDRTDSVALLNLPEHKWNFDNTTVADYRAAAATKHPENEKTFDQWEAPEYLSDLPLPSMFVAGKIVVTVSMAVPGKSEHSKLKIHITKNSTVAEAIETSFEKFKNNLGDDVQMDEKRLIFKMVGADAYMTDMTKRFLDYEDIRRELRQQRGLAVQLMMHPEKTEMKTPNEAEYRELTTPEQLKSVVNRDLYKASALDSNIFSMGNLPMSSVNTPYRLRIVGLDGCNGTSLPRMGPNIGHVWLETFLFVGGQKIEATIARTNQRELCDSPRWLKWFTSAGVNYNTLPPYTRIGFMLYGKKIDIDKDIMLGWASINLVDYNGVLRSGSKNIGLWPEPAKTKDKHGGKKKKDPDFLFKGTTRDNNMAGPKCILRVDFEDFVLPVVAPLMEDYSEPNPMRISPEITIKSLNRKQAKDWKKVQEQDALHPMSKEEKAVVWMCRHHLTDNPNMLCKFLLSVNWQNAEDAKEARRLLQAWKFDLPAAYAIQFLDFKYPDTFVREWVVKKLDSLPDHALRDIVLQLVQCLKYEPYHDGPLTRFLLKRALANPLNIGHLLFWLLKAELHVGFFAERFGVILEEYIAFSDRHSVLLRVQDSACNRLVKISEKIIKLTRAGTDEDAIKEAYKQDLEHLNRSFFLPAGGMYIPSDPRKKVLTLDVNKCRYMSSKMVPLWLVFKNADTSGKDVYLMFKSGDDLRQDMLTLQLLNIMDKMWLAEGLDMRLKPYEVIATGVNDHMEGVGMIQPVINSDTISGIQLKQGGGAMGALKLDPLDLFIRQHNVGKQMHERAVDNFTRSSAGYLVATYILGIGDRHNGNIMLTKEGHLFHIDFGHFLGNFKSKFGVKRERAAFVFTPEMAFVMGGHSSKLFKSFLGLCSSGYAVLRNNANFFEVLFALMVPAGMPELLVESDVDYFRDKMALTVPLKTADKVLRDEVKKSLASRYRRFDNMIHNFKHG